jgi:hypothetical protein
MRCRWPDTLLEVGEERDVPDAVVLRPRAFARKRHAELPEDTPPYEVSAAGIEAAILQSQIERLNAQDRVRVRRHLGLVPDLDQQVATETAAESLASATAMAKMRHPSVARVWKLKAVRSPSHEAKPTS